MFDCKGVIIEGVREGWDCTANRATCSECGAKGCTNKQCSNCIVSRDSVFKCKYCGGKVCQD